MGGDRGRHRSALRSARHRSPAEEFLDRLVDPVLITDLGQGQVRHVLEGFFQFSVELARAVGALDLAVAEEVALGQELVAQEADALAVVLAPVVAVGEVEDVDVPVGRGVVGVDDLVGQVVGRADPRAAALAGVVEGVLVDLAGDGVVDDVAGGHAVVLALEPGVDPERLDPDDLLLVVGHAPRDVHKVQDDRVGVRQEHGVPRAVELVLANRDDHRVAGVVGVRGDLALEGLLVGPLEVAEAFRTRLADAGVLVFFLDDVGPPLGLDPGQFEPLAEDLGQLVQRQLDLQDVPARPVAGAARLVAVGGPADRRADLAGPLAHAARVLRPVAELGDVDLRQGDRYQLAAGLADHLTVGNVFAQVALDLTTDDLLEPVCIPLDFTNHGRHPSPLGVGDPDRPTSRASRRGAPRTCRPAREGAARLARVAGGPTVDRMAKIGVD